MQYLKFGNFSQAISVSQRKNGRFFYRIAKIYKNLDQNIQKKSLW